MTQFPLGTVVGSDGADAPQIESIEKTSTSGLIDTYTITLDDGSEYTFEVTNGADGSSVSVTRVLSSGTKIATLTIDGVSTDLFSPSGGSADIVTSWESTLSDTKVPSEKLTKNTIDTKINTSDIVNDLTTGGTTKVLSAEQGKQLNTLIGNAISYINQ